MLALTKTLNLIIPLFLVIALGYVLAQREFIGEKTRLELNSLIYHIILPLLLFSLTYRLDVKVMFTWQLLAGFPSVIVLLSGMSILIGLLLPVHRRGVFVQGAFRGNLSYLGIPVCLTVLGDRVAGQAALLVGIGAVTNTIISVIVLTVWSGSARPDRSVGGYIKEIFLNPLIVAIGLGFIFSLLHIPMPQVAADAISLIARSCLPLILLLVGMSVSFAAIRTYLGWDLVVAAVKLVLMPAVAYLIMSFIKADAVALKTTMMMCAMPTAVASYSFARQFDADHEFAGSIVNFSTLSMLVTIPVIAYLVM